jgi:hypothetical protein
MVLAKFSCAEPNFKADGVVLLAVPDKGLTYLTRDGRCAKAPVHCINSNKKQMRGFNMLNNFVQNQYAG